MIFTHDFRQDCHDLLSALEAGEPIALARFADGERAVIEGREFTIDGWGVPKAPYPPAFPIRAHLMQSLQLLHENYHVGISCPCCDQVSTIFYRGVKAVPDSRTTSSNIFVNGNADFAAPRLKALVDNGFAVLGSYDSATIKIDRNMVCPFVDPTPVLDEMEKCRGILIAAGPYSCVLVSLYLSQKRPIQALVDVGSSLDPIFRVGTRRYHREEHPNRRKMCQFSL